MANRRNRGGSFDMYKAVTDRIVEKLEEGYIPWEKPWTGGNGAWSRKTGKNYCLINQFLLEAGEYATMDEINREGGKVLKGSKKKYVWSFYYKPIEETDEETGEITKRFLPRQKYIGVFNIETDTDLEVKHDKASKPSGIEPIEALEAIKNDYSGRWDARSAAWLTFKEEHGDSAYYSPFVDQVVVPKKEQFERPAEYYSTVFHELAHSTGHPKRLHRFECGEVGMRFGSEDYSREELCAELTACAILANTGVETSASFRNNAAYIQSWISVLKEDTHAIIRASAKAERAYNMIMGIEENFDDEKGETA